MEVAVAESAVDALGEAEVEAGGAGEGGSQREEVAAFGVVDAAGVGEVDIPVCIEPVEELPAEGEIDTRAAGAAAGDDGVIAEIGAVGEFLAEIEIPDGGVDEEA